MFSLLIFLGIGSTFCQVISGLTLISSSIYGSTNGFSLTCKVQGAIAIQMTIKDPAGNVAATCFRPPSGCGSSAGNTFDRNISEGTFTVNIIQANVNITNHKGVWTCTDGVNVAQYEIKDITSYTKPIIQSEVEVPVTGSVVTVLIGCIYPYPNEVKISYVKESSLDIVLKSRSDVKFDNGSSVNCEHSDARAISMNGSFLVSTDNLNGENARIGVTALLNGVKIGDTGYSNFTIQSEKGCDYSDAELFLGGFSCFLIVLIVSIIMLIILACKMLPDIFGDLKENKKIIIFVVFIVVALSIGLILGLVLKECDQRNLGLGLGLGIGFLLAAALVVTIYVYHRVCNSKKGSQDGQGQDNNGDNRNNTSSTATKAPIGRTRESQNNTGSNTTKNATERVGSPASTSNIELSAKNKAGVPKGEQSALKQKEINTPLPSPPSQPQTAFAHNLPMSRTNQLPPLAKENEEANTVEKKKKKKKKKRKKSEEAGENVDKIQDDDNDN